MLLGTSICNSLVVLHLCFIIKARNGSSRNLSSFIGEERLRDEPKERPRGRLPGKG